jgi:tetratricopeptide (TPR) repeat protein
VQWTQALTLLVGATALLGHDGWALSVAGCGDPRYAGPDGAWIRNASSCASLSQRRNSEEAALQSAFFYIGHNKNDLAREVLSPFEGGGDPRVLYYLAWVDSRLGRREVALGEYRRAVEGGGHLADADFRGDATTHFAYELYRASEYEEAVRILDQLLRAPAGTLPLRIERDARLRLARSLDAMGDAPAAEAELQRLRATLGPLPLSALELLLDAQLHIDSGQFRSADGLLEQARAAARQEGKRAYEVAAVTNRIETAVKEGDWERVHALVAEMASFEDILDPDDRRELAFRQGITAREEGRLDESRGFLEQALALSPPPAQLWEVEYESGLTLQALGLSKEARDAFGASVSQVESQRREVVDPGFQSALIGSREKPYDALFDMFAKGRDGPNALATLQKSLSSRLADDVAQASSNTGPDVAKALGRSAARRSLSEASRALQERGDASPARDARFVAFVTTDSHAWRVLNVAGRPVLEEVRLPPKELCRLMRKFGEDLDDDVGARLGEALFPASTLRLLGGRFAIILPSCARNFPVSAVRIGAGRLVDQAIIAIAPSVSTVNQPLLETRAARTREGLVLANPRGDLPAAEQEARWAGQATGAAVRIGNLASGAAVEASTGRLLHFATHTVVDVAGTALVLADSQLSVADILRRHLHADLVVLASCHSGSRLEATATETLSTAFLRAGSGAVLATLTSVEDDFASRVVRAFYAQGGLDDPAGALTRVQRELERTEPPARWAAFFVAGSPEPLGHRTPSAHPAPMVHAARASGG